MTEHSRGAIDGDDQDWKATEQDILTDPSVSFWLKKALHSSLARDPVDALHDAATLTKVLSARLDRLLAQAHKACA